MALSYDKKPVKSPGILRQLSHSISNKLSPKDDNYSNNNYKYQFSFEKKINNIARNNSYTGREFIQCLQDEAKTPNSLISLEKVEILKNRMNNGEDKIVESTLKGTGFRPQLGKAASFLGVSSDLSKNEIPRLIPNSLIKDKEYLKSLSPEKQHNGNNDAANNQQSIGQFGNEIVYFNKDGEDMDYDAYVKKYGLGGMGINFFFYFLVTCYVLTTKNLDKTKNTNVK